MSLDHLDDKHLLIFAGKGGVGKTTCAAATAMHHAARGRKTLLVTVDPAKRLEDSLGVPLGSTERQVRPNLYASMLDPEEIIRERLSAYAEGARVMEHPLFKYVTNYLPGLNELMAIGRLNEIRHEQAYDVIVIDTAPTGHALSFLSAPKAIQELMSERSLLRWALRGYAVWQKVQKASRGFGRLFGGKKENGDARAGDAAEKSETGAATASGSPSDSTTTASGSPKPSMSDAARDMDDVDLEDVFKRLAAEAREIQTMLTDPARTALNIVTLPEKLPVEETIDLHGHAVREIGIHVGAIIVNKMQPDALGADEEAFFRFRDDEATRIAFGEQLTAAGYPASLATALVQATEFSDVRRGMNVRYLRELGQRLPEVPLVEMPLFKEDVEGLTKLAAFQAVLYRTESEPES